MSEAFQIKSHLLNELASLRRRVAELEAAVARHEQGEDRSRRVYDRLLLDENMDGYAAIDMDGYFLECNAAFRKMLGYTDEELRGVTYLDLTPEKWRGMEESIVREQVISGDVSCIYEKEYVRKDGSVIPVELHTYLIRNRDGQPAGMWAFVRDITERRQSENILIAQRDLSLAVAGATSLQETLRLCLETALKASGLDSGGIYVLDSKTKSFHLSCVRNVSEEFAESVIHISADAEKGRTVLAGRAFYLEGAGLEGILQDEVFTKEGIKSCAVIPISAQGRIIGCLNAASHVIDEIPPHSRIALESIAGPIGLSIQKAQAEESLRESERKCRELVDFLPIPIYEFNADATITAANQATFETFGYDQMDLEKGFNALNIFPPEEKERAWEDIRKRMNGEPIERDDYTVMRKDGSTFPVRILSAPIIEDNRAVGLRGAIIDMTGIRQAEEALRASEARLHYALEGAGDGVWDWNLQTNDVYYSKRYKSMLGYEENEFGNSLDEWDKRVYPEDRERCYEDLEAHFRGQTPSYSNEHRLLCKDGTYKWILDRGKVIEWTADGKPLRIVGTLTDITVLKRAEEAVRESRQRLAEIIDFLPDATFVVDREGRVVTWNRAIEKMTGIRAEEMLGRGDYEYALPFYGERRPMLVDLALHPDGAFMERRYTAIHRSGEILFGEAFTPGIVPGDVHLSATASVLRNSQGEVVAAIECIRDNTEWRKLQERLNRAEKMEGLGRLAGGVAHDLNNVLGILVGYSELLAEMVPDNSPLKRYAENILQSGMRGAAIVQDLLTLARRGVTVSDVVNLNSIIADYLRMPEFERLKFDHPRVRFSAELAGELLNIKGSPVHLSKTVMNLVSNAAEAVSGSGEVTIRTENRYLDVPLRGYDSIQEGDYAVLAVSDTGAGIPVEDLDRIFEPFYTKKVMGKSGTGLGLAVVWGTVKDHNGYIDVHSEV